MEPMVIVNEFAFCQKHGDEYCPRCTYDHRFTNNYQVQDDATIAQIIEDGIYDIEVCPFFSFFESAQPHRCAFYEQNRASINVYNMGAIPVGGNSEECKCQTHNKIDCEKCFNWVAYIKEDAKEARAQAKWIKKREKYFNKVDD